jgi:hypothetical protein
MKQMIRVYVIETQKRYECVPSTLSEYTAWFQGKLDQIPEQFRETANVYQYGDDGEVFTDISYQRPETDTEEAARVSKNQKDINWQLERAEAEVTRLKKLKQ